MSRLIDPRAQHARRGCRSAHVNPTAAGIAWARLTPREQQVLEHVSRPHRTRRRVADELGITVHTVTNHLVHIYAKLDVGSLAEAVRRVGPALEVRRPM